MAKKADHYYQKAKDHGKLARSYFKLEEIDKKFRIFKGNRKVLDLGAAPGAWSQYILENSLQAEVFAIDLSPMKITHPRLHSFEGDVFGDDWAAKITPGSVDVVVSDLAPKTTGITESDKYRSLELLYRACQLTLNLAKVGDHFFVGKVFESPDAIRFIKALKATKVTIERPQATRKSSYEIYVVVRNLTSMPDHY